MESSIGNIEAWKFSSFACEPGHDSCLRCYPTIMPKSKFCKWSAICLDGEDTQTSVSMLRFFNMGLDISLSYLWFLGRRRRCYGRRRAIDRYKWPRLWLFAGHDHVVTYSRKEEWTFEKTGREGIRTPHSTEENPGYTMGRRPGCICRKGRKHKLGLVHKQNNDFTKIQI